MSAKGQSLRFTQIQHVQTSFFLETAGLIEAKFHIELPWDGGTKVCSSGLGRMINMAAISIHGKNHKSSSREPKGWWPWKLVCSIGYSSTTKFVQMMTLCGPWPKAVAIIPRKSRWYWYRLNTIDWPLFYLETYIAVKTFSVLYFHWSELRIDCRTTK